MAWSGKFGAGGSANSASGRRDTVPSLAAFTAVNQGSTTATQTEWGITAKQPSPGSSDSLPLFVRAVPSTPYQAVARLRGVPMNKSNQKFGMVWRESSSGKLQIFVLQVAEAGAYLRNVIGCGNWNSPTSFNSEQITATETTAVPEWWRLRDDGTTRYVEISADGESWVTMGSFARTTFITPDQIGFFLGAVNADFGLSVHSWSQG